MQKYIYILWLCLCSSIGYAQLSSGGGSNAPCDIPGGKIWYRDADGDGLGNASQTRCSATKPSGYVENDRDCNDSNANKPNKQYWRDADGDGYGDPNAQGPFSICHIPNGYVANALDCDDSNAALHPNASDVCDGIDNDCDGQIDEDYVGSTIPTATVNNQCGQSILTRGNPTSEETWYWQSSATGTSTSNSSVSITRASGNTYYLRARNNQGGCWSQAIRINYSIKAFPTPPPTPSVAQNCGNTKLTRTAPPSGISYYWQSNPNGTSTANGSASITRTAGTRYYIRARNNNTGCWSAARVVNYSIKTVPSTPPAVTVSNNCGNSVLTRSNPPSGVTYYWQNTATGTSTASTNATITRTSGSTYYLRGRSSQGCWGTARTVNYSIKTVPSAPPRPSTTQNCGSTILTRSNPPSGVTYYWQSSASGTSTASSGTTLTRTSGTQYYLRARSSQGCWSTATAVFYTVKAGATAPPMPSITQNCGSTTLTRANPPSGVTYYWQSSATGTSTSTLLAGATWTATGGNKHYLRARNNSSGCWSTARVVNYSIKTVPTTPPVVSVNNNCGSSVLTRSNPPSGITYYWQNTATGTSTASTNATITRTSGTTYYLRARSSQGCWSTARTINYTIKAVPTTPPAPSITQDCGSTKLTRSNPPSGVTYYWQNTATGTSTASTNATVTRTNGSVYYLRARNSQGCWSPARTINYNVKTVPATPPTVNISNECGQSVLTRSNPPSGVTYYWQTSATGTSSANSTTTISLTSGTQYYLRARSSEGCWSTARAIQYTIGTIPTWYADGDGDGFGDANTSQQACEQPTGYVANADDNCPTIAGTEQGCLEDYYIAPNLSDENYVYTRVYQRELEAADELRQNRDVIETVAYYDGLGRAKQQIGIKNSPNKKDIITHVAYDAIGRQAKQYLPYEAQTPNGSYTTVNVEQDIQSYYQNKYATDFNAMAVNEVNAYSESIFEPSPLNRVLKQAAPGKQWKASTDDSADHTIESGWEANTLADQVVHFKVAITAGVVNLVKEGNYAAERLHKTITKDENWTTGKDHTTEEYTNELGQMILKRTYNNEITHDTYYVYDLYGNLTYVLPPKVTTADGVSQSELNELCYQYKYDYRNRLIEKKIPGKGWETIVYNKLDQPVLSQDANLKAQGSWLFTKYDALGRVVYTGKINDTRGRAALQTVVNQSTTLWEARTTKQQVEGHSFYYTQNAFPTTGMTLLTINYYDDYALGSIPPLDPGTTNLTWEGMTATTAVKGLLTVGQVRVLDTDKWITTTNYYDEKGRLWDNLVKNEYLGTDTWTLTQLDFVGKPLKTFTKHIKDGKILCTTDVFTYDHMGRLLTQEQQINELPTERILSNHYDELGQLIRKDVGGKTTATAALQNVDYSYNVRGWLKQINDTQNLGTDLFGFRLNYDTPEQGATALFNGNISETHWKTANDNTLRHYTYSYDALNRITAAISNSGRYDLSSVNYDKMGNILNLQRKGHLNEAATSFGVMDNLTYSYDAGNKLLSVNDVVTQPFGFKEYTQTTNEYEYDVNGNMTIDRNKGITNISYNHLNLPTGVNIANTEHSGNISYVYDAIGIKQKKIATEGSNSTITEYSGNYIYKNGVLEFFNHSEGYIEPKGDETFDYIYQYKDHLGNIRLSFSEEGTYETIIDDSFEEGTQNWIGIRENENGRLKIKVLNRYSGTYKEIRNALSKDDELAIKLTIDTYTTTVPIRVLVNERDADNNNLGWYYVGRAEHGNFLEKHKIRNNDVSSILLKLDIDETLDTETEFYIDDVRVNRRRLSVKEVKDYYAFGMQQRYGIDHPNSLISGRKHNYGFVGKEENDELGIQWLDFGARNYDSSIGRWMNIDPLADQMRRHSPYNYAFNNPLRFIDPDGMAPNDIVVPNKADRAAVLKMINSKALGVYAFDNSGKLYQAKSTGDASRFSKYYSDRLNAAIADNQTIEIRIQETRDQPTAVSNGKGGIRIQDNPGTSENIDQIYGGGVTTTLNGGNGDNVLVHISGNENTTLKDTNGNQLEDKAADILAHELVGHAIPYTVGTDTGNAVDNENKVRKEVKKAGQVGASPLRQSEPTHTEN